MYMGTAAEADSDMPKEILLMYFLQPLVMLGSSTYLQITEVFGGQTSGVVPHVCEIAEHVVLLKYAYVVALQNKHLVELGNIIIIRVHTVMVEFNLCDKNMQSLPLKGF